MNITEAEFARIVARQAKPERTVATLPALTEQQEQEAVIQWADAMRGLAGPGSFGESDCRGGGDGGQAAGQQEVRC